jgi:hypothetical protein
MTEGPFVELVLAIHSSDIAQHPHAHVRPLESFSVGC